MTPEEFKQFGEAVLDFVASYLSSEAEKLPVLPSVSPGYLHQIIPNELPQDSETWNQVLADFKTKIMPGITHWQSPHFHAYYPTQTSFPSIVGELLSAGLGIVGFNWITSPACTELEVIVMDWVAKFMSLPAKFVAEGSQFGGGVIQSSASESILVAILAARESFVTRLVETGKTEEQVRSKLVVYTSDQSNSCVEKNMKLAGMQYRLLKTGSDGVMTGEILEEAVQVDLAAGNVPCVCIATMGTTGTCAFDDVEGLARVCRKHRMFIHVDAAYAGAALCLPEFSSLAKSLEHVDSVNFNLHKMMNVNFDCCALWFDDVRIVTRGFNVERIYLENPCETERKWAPDYRHWQIPLGRRFRALKVWFTLRILGGQKLRDIIQNRFDLAKYMNQLLGTDDRIEVVHPARFGLVTFCLRSGNDETQKLHSLLNESRQIFLTPITCCGRFIIRFVVCGFAPEKHHVDFAFAEIQKQIGKLQERPI